MAEAVVEQLYSTDAAEVLHALKLVGSLALDDPDGVVEAGGVATLCGLLSRTEDGSGPIVQEAAVALYLLLEEEDPDAHGAFVSARGRSRVRELLARGDAPEEALSWGQQILDMLPEPSAEELAAEEMHSQTNAPIGTQPSQQSELDPEQLQPQPRSLAEEAAASSAALAEYRVMRRAVARRGVELDSKRGVTLEIGMVLRPVHTCLDPSNVVTRHQLDEEFDSCWISEHGLDGTTILELIGPDGRTPSEVAAAEAEQAAIEAEDAKQRALDEEAARKERFHANLQKQRSDINELQSSFVTMRSTLKTLQGERIAATERVLESSAALKAAAQGVSDAQGELDEAEERRRDAELDIVLTLRAIPGAGSGLSSDLDQHATGGKIVTVSQKRFVPGHTPGSAGGVKPEPEPEPEPELAQEEEEEGGPCELDEALHQAETARYGRLQVLGGGTTAGGGGLSAADAESLAIHGLGAAPFVVLDNFAGRDLCTAVRAEVQRLDEEGQLKVGELGGGRTGANLTYYNSKVRGDRVGWFDGDEPHLSLQSLSRYLAAVDALVGHVGDTLEELLDRQVERSSAMVTCYPGNGSRYIRHIDNPNKNGRLITAIYYMNTEWQPEHGGTLKIYNPATVRPKETKDEADARKLEEASEPPRAEIEPLGDRLLLFFSDTRCPHEVMPSHEYRYAVTTWYSCAKERVAAVQRAAVQAEAGGDQEEEARLQRERDNFAAQTQ